MPSAARSVPPRASTGKGARGVHFRRAGPRAPAPTQQDKGRGRLRGSQKLTPHSAAPRARRLRAAARASARSRLEAFSGYGADVAVPLPERTGARPAVRTAPSSRTAPACSRARAVG